MAKKTYWTKCGIVFQKSSNADVTGYELKLLPSATDPLKVKDDIERVECRTCPFVNLVEEGYPDPVFKRFECRAGSKKPNHETDWTGSLDDKNTININSLNHQLLEDIQHFCGEHPDLSAGYNADHLADCRRTLSISCSSNKKGIAAKRELIEKFFPENAGEDEKKNCHTCSNSEIFEKPNHDGAYGYCYKNGGKYPIYIPGGKCREYKSITKLNKSTKEQPCCAQCGHLLDGICDINNSKLVFPDESHGCTYWQSKSKITDIRCQSCESFSFSTPACTWGKCGKGCTKGEIHKNTFICDSYEQKEQEVEEVKQDCKSSTRACGKCNAGHWYSEENTYVSVVADDGIKTTKRPCEPHTHYCYQFTEGQKKIASDKDFKPDTCPEWCPLEKDVKYTYEADLIDDKEDISSQPEKKPHIGSESGCNEMREDCPCFCKHNDGCAVLIARNDALKAMLKNFFYVDCDVFRRVAEKVNGSPENDIQISDPANDLAENDTKSAETVTFDYSTVDADTAEFLQEKANNITEIRTKAAIALGKELKEAQSKLANYNGGTFVAWFESIGLKKDTVYRNINAYEWVFANCENIEISENIQTSLLFEVSRPSAPKELQEQVLSGDITTHKEYKEKEAEWKAKIDEVRGQQDTLRVEKQQAITKAFDAERKADRLESELDELREEYEALKDQADQQDPEFISNLQNKIHELEQQLRDKPIEAAAVKVVERIPERAAHETVNRLYGTLIAAKLINLQDIQTVHDYGTFERKEAIIEFFENLRDVIPGYLDILKDNVPARKCEDCHYCEWEGLKEEDELAGGILCKLFTPNQPRLWKNEQACENWMERQV